MDELSNRTFPELPRSYRAESRIIEETKFSIALLRTLASVVALTEGKQNSDLIDSRAREFASTWEDREALGFFAYDCPEFRDALRQLVKSLLIHDAPPSGAHYRTLAPINIINGVHPILRGHIESIQTLRVIPAQRSPIVAQFIAIIDERDKLDRDHHHVGWHYHYCKANGNRSDTMLSVDTNQPDKYDAGKINNVPVFWERHAEKDAKFKAKATLWGAAKRENIWTAIRPDVLQRPLNEFRRPKNGASAVWPVGSVLSARPVGSRR